MGKKIFMKQLLFGMVLAGKESAFDLWDEEMLVIPNNFIDILNDVLSDEKTNTKYKDIIPTELTITDLEEEGLSITKREKDIRIDFKEPVISDLLRNKSMKSDSKLRIYMLSETVLRKCDEPRIKAMLKV